MTAKKDWLKRRVKIIVVGIAHKADYTLFVQDLSILYEIFWRVFADLCNIPNNFLDFFRKIYI